jgi:hypothetical protein
MTGSLAAFAAPEGCKLVPQVEGYAVGRDGQVWSCRRWRKFPAGHWRKVSPGTQVSGHLFVNFARDGKRPLPKLVSEVVLMTYTGPRELGQVAVHLDGDLANNSVSNLKWGYRGECPANKRRGGRPKFTARDVERIRERIANGDSCSKIADDLGVRLHAILAIKSGKTWRSVRMSDELLLTMQFRMTPYLMKLIAFRASKGDTPEVIAVKFGIPLRLADRLGHY